MEPLIYQLPKSDTIIHIKKENIQFDNQPSPDLMKYGFNNLLAKIDIMEITSNPNYKVGLGFDFDRNDADSIKQQGMKLLQVKNFNQTFAEFWELLSLFGLLDSEQKILTNHVPITKEIVSSYQKISGKKTKISVSDKSTNNTIVIKKYSDIDLDENAYISYLVGDLSVSLASQEKNANMIIQLFSMQTQIMAELIYYLSTLYTESHLIKPSIVSELSDTKYLVLLGLKSRVELTIPKHPKESYLSRIITEFIPDELVMVIQCMNSFLIPAKLITYSKIKTYLDTKVYEGATYQEMFRQQNHNTISWLEIYTNFPKLKTVLDSAINKSKKQCDHQVELANLFT